MLIEETITDKDAKTLLRAHTEIIQKNIRRLLLDQKITQNELALRINKSKQYVNYLLQHPSPNPKVELLVRIANKLDTTVIDLFKKQ